MRRSVNLILVGVTLALVVLAGGTTISAPQPATAAITLTAEAPVGQSFVTREGGLRAITLQLAPATNGPGTLELSLRANPTAPDAFATATLPLSAVTTAGAYAFTLPQPQPQRDYYFQVTVRGAGAVQMLTTPADTYVDGNLYLQAQAHTGDLQFQLNYDLRALVETWARRAVWWVLVALAALFLLVLPGWALLELGWDGMATLPLSTRLCLALGLGVAVAPALLLWTHTLGWHPGAWHAWLPGLLAAGWLLWRATRRRVVKPILEQPAERWASVALALVAAAVLAVRLALLSQIEVPLWGDAYQHTMIAQLILDHGGLFDAWTPYVPYTTLTVQYGFPTVAALFAWTLGGDGVAGTLVAGQVLNAAAALSLYPLARRMSGDRPWAGVAAVLVAGLLSPLPGYYVNWGRYAQLAGQVALPTVLWLTWALLEDAERPWRRALILGAAVAGMALSYYRMAFLYAPFVLLLVLIIVLPQWRKQRPSVLRNLGGLACAGGVSFMLLLPWALRVAGSSLADKITDPVAAAMPLIEVVRADYNTWLTTPTLMPWPLLVLGGVGLLASLGARRWMLAALLPWTALVALIVAGRLIGLPGANLMQSFAVIIALYIPISLVCGWLFSSFAAWLAAHFPNAPSLTAGIVVALTVAGLPQQAMILTPASILVTRPDLVAMRWINSNTPVDARFLVNGFRIYGGTSAVGADAGWWLPLLAHRANTMPPQYTLLNELANPPAYTEQVVALVATLEGGALGSPVGIQALCANEITHVYVGQGQGAVGASAEPLFTAATIQGHPAFKLLYQHDLVAVYQFRRGVCGAGT